MAGCGSSGTSHVSVPRKTLVLTADFAAIPVQGPLLGSAAEPVISCNREQGPVLAWLQGDDSVRESEYLELWISDVDSVTMELRNPVLLSKARGNACDPTILSDHDGVMWLAFQGGGETKLWTRSPHRHWRELRIPADLRNQPTDRPLLADLGNGSLAIGHSLLSGPYAWRVDIVRVDGVDVRIVATIERTSEANVVERLVAISTARDSTIRTYCTSTPMLPGTVESIRSSSLSVQVHDGTGTLQRRASCLTQQFRVGSVPREVTRSRWPVAVLPSNILTTNAGAVIAYSCHEVSLGNCIGVSVIGEESMAVERSVYIPIAPGSFPITLDAIVLQDSRVLLTACVWSNDAIQERKAFAIDLETCRFEDVDLPLNGAGSVGRWPGFARSGCLQGEIALVPWVIASGAGNEIIISAFESADR
jgi:hypothetical protein